MFFPEKGGSTSPAKFICSRCDVVELCLEDALAVEDRFGIWGGMSERNRRRLIRLRQEGAAETEQRAFIEASRMTFDTSNKSKSLAEALPQTADDLEESYEAAVELQLIENIN